MRPTPTTTQLDRLFQEAVDGALDAAQEAALERALADDPALRARFDAYRGAVSRLQAAPRARAPQALSAMVLRRSRRRRFQLGQADGTHGMRVPAEVLVPILLGVLAAVLLVLGWT
jgi:anti-sigma factor RsiW